MNVLAFESFGIIGSEHLELASVEAVEPVLGPDPQRSDIILDHAGNGTLRQSVGDREITETIGQLAIHQCAHEEHCSKTQQPIDHCINIMIPLNVGVQVVRFQHYFMPGRLCRPKLLLLPGFQDRGQTGTDRLCRHQ